MARSTKQVQFSLTPETFDFVNSKAAKLGVSRSAYISLLINSDRQRDDALLAAQDIKQLAEVLQSSTAALTQQQLTI